MTELTLSDAARRRGRMLAWLAALLVLVVTMYPTRAGTEGSFFECLVCGERGLADVFLNVALFVPFGAAIALGARSWHRALAYAMLLSVVIELQQQGIPGRHSSVGDLVFNTLGASVGVLLLHTRRGWMAPRPELATRLSLAAALFLAAVIALTGWLLTPALPGSTYFVQWTPALAHLHRYDGQVVASALGGRSYLPGPVADSRDLQRGLEAGESLTLHGVAGRSPRGLAPFFAIHDAMRREVVLVGPDRDDLVMRFHSRAIRARLDQPDLRVIGALRGIAPGDSLAITTRLHGDGHCIAVNGHWSCSYGFTAGRGWALLLYLERFPPPLRGTLDAAWMALLSFPIGLWARRRRTTSAALAVAIAAIVVVPVLGSLRPATLLDGLGALIGFAAGIFASRIVRRPGRARADAVSPADCGEQPAGNAVTS